MSGVCCAGMEGKTWIQERAHYTTSSLTVSSLWCVRCVVCGEGRKHMDTGESTPYTASSLPSASCGVWCVVQKGNTHHTGLSTPYTYHFPTFSPSLCGVCWMEAHTDHTLPHPPLNSPPRCCMCGVWCRKEPHSTGESISYFTSSPTFSTCWCVLVCGAERKHSTGESTSYNTSSPTFSSSFWCVVQKGNTHTQKRTPCTASSPTFSSSLWRVFVCVCLMCCPVTRNKGEHVMGPVARP